MRTYRENPDGIENELSTKQTEREKFALKMQAKQDSDCCLEEIRQKFIDPINLKSNVELCNVIRKIAEVADMGIYDQQDAFCILILRYCINSGCLELPEYFHKQQVKIIWDEVDKYKNL